MSFSSPPCYLDLLVPESDWMGTPGASQVASLDGWRLSVEPRAGQGWFWSVQRDPSTADDGRLAQGMVAEGEVADPEAEAKVRAADAWRFAREDGSAL
jgi:hypothetical protein